jgi:hypothetical protein
MLAARVLPHRPGPQRPIASLSHPRRTVTQPPPSPYDPDRGRQQPDDDQERQSSYGQQPYAGQNQHGQHGQQQQGQYGGYESYGQQYPSSYGQQQYGMAPPNNTMALVSLIAGIAGLTVVPFIGSVVAVITGHIARRQIAERGEGGSGMATAGLITGWVGVVLGILAIVALVLFFGAIAATVGPAGTT